MFYTITGLKCPSCGNTRALHALLHGDLQSAFIYNPLAFVLIPLAAAVIFMLAAKRRSLSDRAVRFTLYAYIAVYIIWWIVRNIFGW